MTRNPLLATLVLLFSLMSGFAQADAAATAPVDINSADAVTLASLDGIGDAKADAIVAYRDEHGPFATVSDLSKVSGIGKKTVENNAARLTVK
ncbi:ComEA family DNA-binding protein [Marinobacter caseinilyticus]|uniref:ComEA family DNA-binding protein n=1 Tax=Marinobacter caseinilyticus TaxID=2692195 RepID=UPI00140E5A60|nr:helix-hairpin-helix domain-containing protein [Marinobacter caseinilyticus]